MRHLLTASVVVLIVMSHRSCAAPPDVLMIVVDDLRPMLRCYGDSRIHTPNIDRLAERSVVFRRAYCQYAKCGTSRLSMLTGLRPNSIGVYSNNKRDVDRFRQRRADAVSLPAWFKQQGYHTRSFGKIYHDGWDRAADWSVASSAGRDQEMLEVVRDEDPSAPTVIADRFHCPVMQTPDVADNHLFAGRMTDSVVKVLQHRDSSEPQFLAVGFRRPHLPFVVPQRYADLYDPDDGWLAANSSPPLESPVMAWFNSDGYVGAAKRVGLSMPLKPDRKQAIDWNGYELRSYRGVPNQGPIPRSVQLRLLQGYAACISYVDAQIGRLLDELEKSNRVDSTIVVLCSDHGWHLGEHSAWGKMTNFEVATRIPMLIAAPGYTSGQTQTIVELVDLYPTLCDLTGLPVPSHLQGESLINILRNPSAPHDDSVAVSQYSRFRNRYSGTALRTSRYRFIRWVAADTNQVVHRELYDHHSDAEEMNNLAGDAEHAGVIKRLEARLLAETDR